jgi:hypothetical protein
MLVLVLLFTLLTAALDTVTRIGEEPRPSFTILVKLEPESGPVPQTFFPSGRCDGNVTEAVRLRFVGVRR